MSELYTCACTCILVHDQCNAEECTTCCSLPVVEGIFDVVAGGVDEDARVIPAGTLHTHVLMHCTQTLQLAVAYSQSCEKGGRGVSEGGREAGGREEGEEGAVEREGNKRYGGDQGRKMRITHKGV